MSDETQWYMMRSIADPTACAAALTDVGLEVYLPMVRRPDPTGRRLIDQPLLADLILFRATGRQALEAALLLYCRATLITQPAAPSTTPSAAAPTTGITAPPSSSSSSTIRPLAVDTTIVDTLRTMTAHGDPSTYYLLSPDAPVLQRGRPIIVTDGQFLGATGLLLRHRHDTRLVINIPRHLALATAYIPRSCYTEIIEDNPK